ncbi:MAG: adenylosuccinate lyase [Chrysiogenetes bacterium]|nr:adenylosuccinate lyase [Chrysiogenetes bacterium]
MIERYSRPRMVQIWEPGHKFYLWLEIELLACEANEKLGVVPAGVSERLRKAADEKKVVEHRGNGSPRHVAARVVERSDEIEREVRHDVIAFLTAVAEELGDEARYLHLGMTSSDVLDTCLAKQLHQAGEILLDDLDELLQVLQRRAIEHKNTLMIGRSHGIHAEPTTFGLVLARHYSEFKRHRQRLYWANDRIGAGKVSGAVGTFANIDPSVEEYVCQKLGLKPDPVSSQVVARDRHAEFFQVLALIGASIENLAVEVRHLQRTEVREAEEFFHKGQKGSSAMPHKRNPVLSENLTGLARLLRGYSHSALENVALWHERDISHSSVERVIAPDATVTCDFALGRLTGMMDKLTVYPERMQENLDSSGGLHNSQRVLLALTKGGLSREKSYAIVQRCAMAAWESRGQLIDQLLDDKDVTGNLSEQEIRDCFDESYHTKHVETIFQRVFG